MLHGRRPRSQKAGAALADCAELASQDLRIASMHLTRQAFAQCDCDRSSYGLARQLCQFAGEQAGLGVLDTEAHYETTRTDSTLCHRAIDCQANGRHLARPGKDGS